MATELLRAVLVALLVRGIVEGLRRWGGIGPGAEIESAIAAWVGHTVDLACFLLAELFRARRRRARTEQDS